MLFCIRHFSQTINFSRFSIPKSIYFCIIFHDFSRLFRHRFSHRFLYQFLVENGSRNIPFLSYALALLAPFSRPFSKIDSFTLRACPPTHLHAAQFLRSAAYSQRNFLAAQCLLFLANRGGPQGGTRDPNEGAPRAQGGGPGGPSGPPGGGRLRRPWGPLGPLG